MNVFNKRSPRVFAAGIAVLISANGCRDTASPSEISNPRLSSSSASQFKTIDEEFASLGSLIPGFAGYYLESGRLVVALADPAQRERARAVLRETLAGRDLAHLGAPIDVDRAIFRSAGYSFVELQAWRRSVNNLFSTIPGITLTDVDEIRNRVRVGVADVATKARLLNTLSPAVPAAAIEFVVVSRPSPLLTLNDRAPVKQGGFEVQFAKDGAVKNCTLGFNARRLGSTLTYFITNSHCSQNMGFVDSTDYYQNSYYSNLDFIGLEVLDPPFFTNAQDPLCPPAKNCRWSDALQGEYTAGVSIDLGYIAKTASFGSVVGSKTVVGRFHISGSSMYPTANAQVFKMGQETGWTSGNVNYTCVDVPGAGDQMMLCQSSATMGAEGGDSGSPIFSGDPESGPVVLLGLLWGKTAEGTLFSNMAGIQEDLRGHLIIR
ncbi:MAG: hypothetical protein WKF55_16310 [Gemmatimonadaceae bacterium]